jgi:Tol biopolymer transport system component
LEGDVRRKRAGVAALLALLLSAGAVAPGSAQPSQGVRCEPPDPVAVSTRGLRFTSDRTGNREVFETSPQDTSQPHDITNNAAPDYAPSAQSNAGMVAFVSERDGNAEIYCTMVGYTAVNLTQDPSTDTDPSMTADGTRIAFASNRSGNFDIWVMNSDGTGLMDLTNDPSNDVQPAFSPDGTKIAFVSDRLGDNDIFVMNADGSGTPTDVADDPGEDANPSFSKDGTRIAFDSDEGGDRNIYTVSASGGTQTRVTNSPADDIDPTYSPDGSQIAFTSNLAGNQDIWIVGADGSNAVRVTSSTAADNQPDWQAAPTPPCCPEQRGFPILYLHTSRHPATKTVTLYGAYQIKNGPSTCRVAGRRVDLYVSPTVNGAGHLVGHRNTGKRGNYQFVRSPRGTQYWHTVAPGPPHCGVKSKTVRTRGFA